MAVKIVLLAFVWDPLQDRSVMADKYFKISVSSAAGVSDGQARVRVWSGRERVLRVVMTAFGALVGALVALFIPVVHLLLFPTAFLVGIFLTYRAFLVNFKVLDGSAVCPACGTTFAIQSGATTFPFRDFCAGCNRGVEISLCEKS